MNFGEGFTKGTQSCCEPPLLYQRNVLTNTVLTLHQRPPKRSWRFQKNFQKKTKKKKQNKCANMQKLQLRTLLIKKFWQTPGRFLFLPSPACGRSVGRYAVCKMFLRAPTKRFQRVCFFYAVVFIEKGALFRFKGPVSMIKWHLIARKQTANNVAISKVLDLLSFFYVNISE